jgi:hypothetical protein
VRVIILTGVLVYLLSILAVRRLSGPWYLSPPKKLIWYEIQLLDELVDGSFEPPDARAACDGICRHFVYGSYVLKVW